jgi:ADP-heptose:LPS heptosyltransferase
VLPKKILVIRFSAMGDVVLLVPVLRSLVNAYPEVQVTVLTRPKFSIFFAHLPGVAVFAADVDKEYTGLNSLLRLFNNLLKLRFNTVIDVHDHLRTKVLRTLFYFCRVPVVVFDKGRGDKKKFTRKVNKVTHTLPHTVERYQQAFHEAGFKFPFLKGPHLVVTDSASQTVTRWLTNINVSKNETWIGIAPFAMHYTKMWPVHLYKSLIALLLKKQSCRFFLFGGGQKEIDFFTSLLREFPDNTTIVAGQLKLEAEWALMQQLDLMLCVDSSNMHLATLVGTPLLSIWGGTHPAVGFGPFQRDDESIIELSRGEISCRPCSVYGKETCYRGDFACMMGITPQMIAERIIRQVRTS